MDKLKCNTCEVKKTLDNYTYNEKKEAYIGKCNKCREASKAYRDRNKKHIKERDRLYRVNNPEKVKKINRDYYEENKEEMLEKNKLYKEKHQCIHNVPIFKCRECSGKAEHLTILGWVVGCKSKDKQKNMYEEKEHIDYEFCEELVEMYSHCPYCDCDLNYDRRNPQLATIERLDNDIGHIKSNCIIACFRCNSLRV